MARLSQRLDVIEDRRDIRLQLDTVKEWQRFIAHAPGAHAALMRFHRRAESCGVSFHDDDALAALIEADPVARTAHEQLEQLMSVWLSDREPAS